VRNKLIVAVIALFLATVPASLATSGSVVPVNGTANPVKASAVDVSASTLRSEARSKARVASKHAKRRAKARGAAAVAVSPQMQAIAECESHGNPRSIGGGGLYRGKYQMTTSIWASVGGKGDPAAAPEAEQDRRAAMLYQRSGPGQWPVCGQ
jgi:transglycosylase-like protein